MEQEQRKKARRKKKTIKPRTTLWRLGQAWITNKAYERTIKGLP